MGAGADTCSVWLLELTSDRPYAFTTRSRVRYLSGSVCCVAIADGL